MEAVSTDRDPARNALDTTPGLRISRKPKPRRHGVPHCRIVNPPGPPRPTNTGERRDGTQKDHLDHRRNSYDCGSPRDDDRNFPGTSESVEGFLRASNRGLEYRRGFLVPAAVLDEDKDGTDEVFVRARFVDGDCASRIQSTNVVKGNF